MRCQRCHSTMVQTSITREGTSVQERFTCPLCARQSMHTARSPLSALAEAGRSGGVKDLLQDFPARHAGWRNGR